MRIFSISVIFALLLLSLGTAFAQLTEIQNLRSELLQMAGAKSALVNARLAPDGERLLWQKDRTICTTTLADFNSQCFPLPDAFQGSPTDLSWSPEGDRIAFTEDLISVIEGDIWTLNPQTGEVVDLTDDGVGGDLFSSTNFTLDTSPVWTAAGDLYFLRTAMPQGYAPDALTKLYRLPAGSDQAEEVHDLGGKLTILNLALPPAISSDGSQIAVAMFRPPDFEAENGVWLLNLSDNSFTQIATVDDFQVGLPAWLDETFLPDNISWAQGGLVLTTRIYGNTDLTPLNQSALYISTETGEITPLAGFSDVGSPAALTVKPSSGEIPVFRVPRAGIVAADGGSFYSLHYFNFEGDFGALLAQPLPPDGSEPITLGEITDFDASFPPQTASISADGASLFAYGYLFVLDAP